MLSVAPFLGGFAADGSRWVPRILLIFIKEYVMRKILLGISVLISLAFLASCGGGSSGSSGAAGAAGADGAAGTAGATGATGSITVFEDTNLLASFNGAAGAVPGSTPTAVPLDSGAVIGKLSGALSATGLDNLTADSRNRYYVYTETSAGVQNLLNTEGGTEQIESLLNTQYNVQDECFLRVRSQYTKKSCQSTFQGHDAQKRCCVVISGDHQVYVLVLV